MGEAFEMYREEWLTADKLVQVYGCFSKGWIKSYGHTLPRTQAIVKDKEGMHRSSWVYPRHKIARMIADGKIKDLKI